MDYLLEFYEAKYHLSVAQRMLGIYEEYAEKRVLVGVIREGAKAAGKLVRAFLIREGVKGNLKTFAVLNLVNILEVERAQRICKVEFARKDEVLMEVNGDWKILKVSRLREFVESVSDIVSSFPTDIKR